MLKNRQLFSEVLKEISQVDSELSYENTLARLYDTGGTVEPVKRRVELMTAFRVKRVGAQLYELPCAVY